MTHTDLPRDPNAEITDAIVALPQDQRAPLQALAMAVVDRVQVLTGLTQIRTEEQLLGIRGQLTQVIGNLPIVSDHLKRQDIKLDEVLARTDKIAARMDASERDRARINERLMAVETELTGLQTLVETHEIQDEGMWKSVSSELLQIADRLKHLEQQLGGGA